LFQPLLYQVASGGLSESEIAQPLRHILERQTNLTILMDEVASINTDVRKVELRETPELEYDYLVVALGLRTGYFGNNDWEQYAPGLKCLDEATEIRRRILDAFEKAEKAMQADGSSVEIEFVVVGGGPTGVELAGSIAELSRHVLKREFKHIDTAKAKVHLIEAGPRLLPVFNPKHSDYTLRALESMGVTVHLNAPVSEVGENYVVFGGERIETNLTFWAAGLEAGNAPRTIAGAERDRAGRIAVENDFTLPGDSRVYIVGDLASMTDVKGVRVPGVAPAAMQSGKHAAKQIINDLAGRPREPFKYLDKGSMATIGRTRAVVEFKNILINGFFAWGMWLAVHLLFLVGLRNRITILHQWVWAYFTWNLGARIMTQKRYSQTVVK
ncbi:MAG: NAD(P)/FAD-dependent oxidoreductase, partial [Verrucomicrobiota bacterium]